MVLEAKYNLTGVGIEGVIFHHRTPYEQFFEDEQRAMLLVNSCIWCIERCYRLVIDFLEPVLGEITIPSCHNLEASADSLGSNLTDEISRVLQSVPDDIENLGDEAVHERRRVSGHLPYDEDSCKLPAFLLIRL